MKKQTQGFTLIELLVVIAIIGILSSIVIASLNSARSKGKDAAIKGQAKQLQTQAETYYDSVGTFGISASSTGSACITGVAGTVFATTTVAAQVALLAANDAPNSTTICTTDSTGQKWSLSISGLNGGGFLCVDNSGSFKSSGAVATSTAGACI